MKNLHKWEDLVGSNGRYKIRLSEDNRTVEIIGPRGVKLRPSQGKMRDLYCTVSYVDIGRRVMRIHQLSYKQWVDPAYFPASKAYVIDHIDSDPTNNHPNNLRLISHRANCSKERTIKSGLPVGVVLEKKTGAYRAIIRIKGIRIGLGTHKTPEQASTAYQKALKELVHV